MQHIPRKRFGQNFLQDQKVIHDIITAIHPQPGDPLVEIGPGLAALTEPLLNHTTPLHVIEIDRDIVAHLQTRFPADELIIHQLDALKMDFTSLRDTIAPGKKLRVVGNLPYNISTPLLFHLAEHHAAINDMHFMLQKEVVERLAAQPSTRDYGRLSVMLQYRFAMLKVLDVPPTAFYPAPKVDSAIIRIVPYPTLPFVAKDEAFFAALVTQAFSQRRKTIRNTLRTLADEAQLQAAGIDPGRRPETLTVQEYVTLSNHLGSF
jgi:16S rRNA (adenine1518-N6/adenine1519-N6)-dimethyltransferase